MADDQAIALDALNAMSREDFVAAVGEIFEHAPWVAEQAYARRPFATVTALHEAMLAGLAAASPETVTDFLNRHPDLAAPAARMAPLTAHSAHEQGAAGLDGLTATEAERLVTWNAQYRARFGFPFILCVRRHARDSIFSRFEHRLTGEPEAERQVALAEIGRITALRLVGKIIGSGMPQVHGHLSTHLLDTVRGGAARGVPIELFLLTKEGGAARIATAVSNNDGRTDAPLIAGRPIPIGTYELRFAVGAYLAQFGGTSSPPFLDVVPVRFGVADPEGHYHIPLLFTPWSYATYRGS
ncbi:MAG TPA: 2-oxo-4-hydroxy-4-carboxy-5-ureidoimidazoline decarboxylase [Stellaceae bacterium]|jgi:2-oxo-4-hydroxy-4-carboxy-5-ureidoimidazoline decarboxylase|nr:2-oxo-4-hydroxy-4-carboxy-5-ureidoimidazoline decarboxylase [Stellaceae bacterium]